MATKRKKTAAIAAGVLSAALLLGGTFAWMSMDQEAKNESAGVVNVGGRLHDDYDGYNRLNESSNTYSLSVVDTQNGAVANKDIYVENFTDAKTGGYPIYARVRMSEYMEVGPEAGAYTTTEGISTFDAGRKAVSVVPGAVIDDKSTWAVHKPSTEVELCETECTCGVDDCKGALHSHWTWTMGNDNPVAYMPTFDRDKDSIAADVNGSWRGLDAEDMVYFDDYVLYTTDKQAGLKVDATTNTATDAEGNPLTDENGNVIDFTGVEVLTAVDGPVYSVKDYAYYDDDTNGEPNGHGDPLYGATSEVETHFAQNTGTAEVITMEEWLSQDGKNKAAGDYWVYDGDGWAYWANPIMPGQATGLLLDSIEMILNPGEKSYYAIHVEAEFATVGDWSHFTGFDAAGENANAAELLQAASENVTYVTVTQVDGFNSVHPGGELQFEASTVKGLAMGLSEEDFEWFICDAEGKEYTGKSTIEGGLLQVAEDEAEGTVLLVGAESVAVPGAVGLRSVTVRTPEVELEIASENEIQKFSYGLDLTEPFTLKVSGKDAANGTISWAFRAEEGGYLSSNKITPSQDGLSAEVEISKYQSSSLFVTASYTTASGYVKTVEYPIEIDYNIVTTDDLAATPYVVMVDDVENEGMYEAFFLRSYTRVDNQNSHYGDRKVRYFVEIDENTTSSNVALLSSESEYLDTIRVTTLNVIKPKSCAHWFKSWKLKSADLSKLDTSLVKQMNNMFDYCTQLESIIFGENWNTAAVTSMYEMFADCRKLNDLDVSKFTSENLMDVSSMFYNCYALEEVDFGPEWTLAKVDSLYRMFFDCAALKNCDLSSLCPEQPISFQGMFYQCQNLETVNFGESAEKLKASHTGNMFYSCKKLTSLDLSRLDTTEATKMFAMFSYCEDLQTLILGENWSTAQVTDMDEMFKRCFDLILDCSAWNVSNVTSYTDFVTYGVNGVTLPLAWQTTESN